MASSCIGARGLNSARSIVMRMAVALILTGMPLFALTVQAQTGIFSIFQPKEVPPEPYADAGDDHANWAATGAPIMLRPSDEMLRRAPTPSALPLPPRRPDAPANPPPAATGQTPAPSPTPAPSDAPSPSPSELIAEPAPAEVPPPMEDELPAGEGPNMRQHASLPPSFRNPLPTLAPPPVPEKVTPEEIEQEEKATPEPTYVERQTDYVNIRCLKPALMSIVERAGKQFNAMPIITSGQREHGRRGSYHRRCMAADFFIPGIDRSVLASWLRRQPDAGGVGTYCHTKSVHIDVGDPRNWWQCGRRFRFSQR